MRVLCVWYPDWPLQVLENGGGECLVVEPRPDNRRGGAAQVVRAADRASQEAGVHIGMGRRAAEALCPTARVIFRDLGAETRRFEEVIDALEGLIPRVEVVEPGLAFLLVEGALRYYGGEEELMRVMEKELAGVASGAQLGLAEGPFAARWAALSAVTGSLIVTDTTTFLADLDVSALEHEELIDTFRWLGVTTLGSLASLPREAIASRFGSEGLVAHRLASGEDRSPQPRTISPLLAAEAHYDDPLENLEQLAFASRALSARLMNGLHREGIAPHRVEITAEAANGTCRSRVWRSTDPFTEYTLIERVWWQLRAWIEQGGIPGGLVRLRLDPQDLSGDGRQMALLETVGDGWQGYDPTRPEAERALARVQALVGPDAVLQADSQGGRLPVERIQWHRWGEEVGTPERSPDHPWAGTTPGPSPALVPPQLTPLEVEWDEGMPVRLRLSSRWEVIHNWAGPWRLSGRWWKGEGHADRYQLVTSAGAFLIVVTEGKAYVAGIYD
ncbi:MAG TPA: DNA polymerase Y family protein [Acidimicrobiia bacterium]|nr:DNA polymerase Y family protein [Acidimicrobiia bacterium]